MDLKSQIRGILEDTISFEKIDLVDLEFSGGEKRKKLVLYIDKPGGVNIDDCELVSKKAGLILEVNDIIPFSYVLEVSSPGLDRPLVTPRDFERNIGRLVDFSLTEEIDGKTRIEGTVKGVIGEAVEVESSAKTVALPIAKIKNAKRIIKL